MREVIKNTPLKKVTKLVNCGNDIVAAIGFDDHLRFASVKDMAFIDDDFDNSNDNNDQECHRRAVKFEQQPIDVCVVSVSVSISQDEEEEEEEEEEPLLPKTTKVTTKEVHHCELMITFANGLAKLVPIEYEKSSSSSDNNGGGGELKILFDKIQQIDVRTTIQTTTIQTTTTRRKKRSRVIVWTRRSVFFRRRRRKNAFRFRLRRRSRGVHFREKKRRRRR